MERVKGNARLSPSHVFIVSVDRLWVQFVRGRREGKIGRGVRGRDGVCEQHVQR